MKKLYPVFVAITLLFIANFPSQVSAQCTCSGGLPATAVTQSQTISPTVASSLSFSFQQFDPTIGTLSCVTLLDTISAVTVSTAINSDPDSTAYLFLLTVPSKITAPGISITKVFTKTYGYDTLAPHGMPGDRITYGPDVVAHNYASSGSTGGNASYLGTGNVSILYSITGGGLQVLDGGINDTTTVATTLGGTINLTYYWCPSAPLTININDFTAFKNGQNIQLQWHSYNEQSNVTYQIQSSKDGSNFEDDGSMPPNFSENDSVSSYKFMYPVSNAGVGTIYFRIRRIDGEGKSSYSVIKTINLGASGLISYQVYPNPIANSVMLEFNDAQTGNFVVSLVNTAGQAVQQKMVTLSGSNQIKMDLTNKPTPGLYFLQAKDVTHNQQYVTKILVK